MTTTLKITAKGQVTLKREILEHLGAHPGDRLDIDLLPGGQVRIRQRGQRPIESLFGRLAAPGTRKLEIEEIDGIARAGWAGKR